MTALRTPGAGSVGQGTSRHLEYLSEVCELLWPFPAVVTMGGGSARPGGTRHRIKTLTGGADREFFLLPPTHRPRLVVPAASRAAAGAIRGYGQPGPLTSRAAVKVLAPLLACGLGGALLHSRLRVSAPPGANTIESYLHEVLGKDIWVSMHLGPARANRKPVLQLLTAGGEPVGFAKLGVNPLTRKLVRAERDALLRLGRANLANVTVPTVLHFGEWRGLDILLLGVLPVWRRRRPLSATRLDLAMSEVALVGGLQDEPLSRSPYWKRLRLRLAAADAGPDRLALQQALDAVAARNGSIRLSFGSWHGDWTPWNLASTADGLLVWDWERFDDGVPAGFDALHYQLQKRVMMRRRDPALEAITCVESASLVLAPFRSNAEQAKLTALLYLVELAARYLADRQVQAGARLGAPGKWLIPTIEATVAQL
jgi:hypothetical protein